MDTDSADKGASQPLNEEKGKEEVVEGIIYIPKLDEFIVVLRIPNTILQYIIYHLKNFFNNYEDI